MSKWIDISQPLTNNLAHWPGDTSFEFSLTSTKQETGSVNIGQMTTSLHSGTHVDAPFHFDSDGQTIDQVDLDIYIGKAYVLDVSHKNVISPKLVNELHLNSVQRLLLKTSLPNNPERFPETIPYLDPTIAPILQEKGIKLLGVDMPSVDAINSKNLQTHHALYQQQIYILENLMLDHVDEGFYELIALPLAINGGDGSPVRAVLRKVMGVNEDDR